MGLPYTLPIENLNSKHIPSDSRGELASRHLSSIFYYSEVYTRKYGTMLKMKILRNCENIIMLVETTIVLSTEFLLLNNVLDTEEGSEQHNPYMFTKLTKLYF